MAELSRVPDRGSLPDVAILIPCLDEERTIGPVVTGFLAALPSATIYVFDNASQDATASLAAAAGAIVRPVPTPGKGAVVRRMFADVDADLYVIVDGDGTYDPADAPRLIDLLLSEGLDMVVGARTGLRVDAFRVGHTLGNRLFNDLYRWLFGAGFSDILSGYRVFSRRFVTSFPAVATGFEIETEMSVHASQLRLPVAELDVSYRQRPPGSRSKLRTVTDGIRILRSMLTLLRDNRPLVLFGALATGAFTAAAFLGVPVFVGFSRTGLVERLPSAVLASGLVVVGLVSAAAGLILDAVAKARIEAKRLAYISGRSAS